MRIAIAAALAASACSTLPADNRGAVYQFNGETVTIRGGFDFGSTAAPTPEMVAQARAVCPNARYVSATPADNDYQFLYLFVC